MGKYLRKPTIVEAIRYTPPPNGNIDELIKWGARIEPTGAWGSNYDIQVYNGSHDDWNLMHPGDWIIRGVAGEFYPCEAKIFEETYEEVT